MLNHFLKPEFVFFQFVAMSFWGIYAVDSEMIHPAKLAIYTPTLLNHFQVILLIRSLS